MNKSNSGGGNWFNNQKKQSAPINNGGVTAKIGAASPVKKGAGVNKN